MDRFSLCGEYVAGKFEIESAICEVGHVVTYRAQHAQTGEPYRVDVFKVADELTADERDGLLRNLIRSAVKVRRAAEDNYVIGAAEEVGSLTLPGGERVPYMATPDSGGVSLRSVICQERELALPARSLSEVMELLEQVALALSTAHVHGVVHAGVTLESIVVSGDARSKLVDVCVLGFGAAQAVADAREAPREGEHDGAKAMRRTVVPSFYDARFAAPEQLSISGEAVSEATDVYSLALVMAHLLTEGGERMRDDPTFYLATPGGRGVMLDPGLEAVFVAALSHDPRERPQSVMSFWNRLRGDMRMPALSVHDEDVADHTDVQPASGRRVAVQPADVLPPAEGSMGPTTHSVTDAAPSIPSVRGSRGVVVVAAAALFFVVAGGAYAISRSLVAETAGDDSSEMRASAGEAGNAQASAAPPRSHVTERPIDVKSGVTAPLTCPPGMAFIPAGEFFMGSDEPDALDSEGPAHHVLLSAYCIDLNEVTVSQYKACSDAGKCRRASKVNVWMDIDAEQRAAFDPLCNMNDPGGRADHPVNCLTWQMSQDFCAVQNKRLPTEAEWELAARGTDGRIYPWGDEPPTAEHLNACGSECVAWANQNNQALTAMYDTDDGYAHTAPVGSFPKGASKYGLHDVVGNVWEWVGDGYLPYTDEEQTDPRGPTRSDMRVMRGGAWNGGHVAWVRPTFRHRDYPDVKGYGIGFRCARTQ